MSADLLDLLPISLLAPSLVDATGDARWAEMRAELISGGKSNLTFTLSSSAGEVILRRPPTGKLLPSAHDMAREARVQAALADTSVPTATIMLVDEGDLLGFPFYIMEKVAGHVVRGELPPGYATTPGLLRLRDHQRRGSRRIARHGRRQQHPGTLRAAGRAGRRTAVPGQPGLVVHDRRLAGHRRWPQRHRLR